MTSIIKNGAYLDDPTTPPTKGHDLQIDSCEHNLFWVENGVISEDLSNHKISLPSVKESVLFRVAQQSLCGKALSKAAQRFVSQYGYPYVFRHRGKFLALRVYPLPSISEPKRLLVVQGNEHDYNAISMDLCYLNELNTKELAHLRHRLSAANETMSALQEKAETDNLTSLYNRHAAHRLYPLIIATAQRQNKPGKKKTCITGILTDLDRLKIINDNYGHDAGDDALRHIANVLAAKKRASDTLIRWGGEEMLLLAFTDNKNSAIKIAERLRKSIIATPFNYNGHDVPVTASFGVTVFDPCEKTVSLEDLVIAADKGLYEAKDAGRNKVIYAPLEIVSYTRPQSVLSSAPDPKHGLL